ncbi:MAG: hypothetical protein LBE89_06200 [Helicobacteraceae bacterium]|jgi:hypothetical protein|nr:hypothetical protein [Helicobacteraceae bacterium]
MAAFGEIAKIRRLAVENLQKELQIVQSDIFQTEGKIETLKDELSRLPRPESGGAAELAVFCENSRIYRRDIKSMSRELFTLRQKAFQVRFRIKNAQIEFEKANHLDKEEKAQAALFARKNEEKQLGETVSNMRYVGGRTT